MTLSRTDSRARLPAIAVDTLVLCGENDTTCPAQMSRDIAAAIPHARIAIIAGAGHYVTLDRPDRVAKELAAWLARPSPLHIEGMSHGRRR
jgi:pimeloyl-ACP methyl ester carboxylesterase